MVQTSIQVVKSCGICNLLLRNPPGVRLLTSSTPLNFGGSPLFSPTGVCEFIKKGPDLRKSPAQVTPCDLCSCLGGFGVFLTGHFTECLVYARHYSYAVQVSRCFAIDRDSKQLTQGHLAGAEIQIQIGFPVVQIWLHCC